MPFSRPTLWSRSNRPAPDRLRCAAGVIRQSTGETSALIDLRRGQYFTLNEIGGRMWELLASHDGSVDAVTGTSVGAADPLIESMASQIADEYAVPRDRVRHDVECFLRELAAVGLVVSTGER